MRRILLILSIFLITTIQSTGQAAASRPSQESVDPIVRLYPNPATTYVTFDMQKNFQRGLSIQVYSFLGKKMYEGQNVNEKTTVDLSDFNRGVYIYHIKDAGGKILEQGKFQVTK